MRTCVPGRLARGAFMVSQVSTLSAGLSLCRPSFLRHSSLLPGVNAIQIYCGSGQGTADRNSVSIRRKYAHVKKQVCWFTRNAYIQESLLPFDTGNVFLGPCQGARLHGHLIRSIRRSTQTRSALATDVHRDAVWTALQLAFVFCKHARPHL